MIPKLIDKVGYAIVDGKRVGERAEPKVLCVVIAPIGLKFNKRCYNSWMKQNYPNYSVLIHYEKPIVNYGEYGFDLNVNCSHNRNQARQASLASDADYFLFLDSDIELPPTAISSFMTQTGSNRATTREYVKPNGDIIPKGTPVAEKHIQGGWYPIIGYLDGGLVGWAAGVLVADETIQIFKSPEHSLVKADFCGCGCLFITRKALIDNEFSHGLDVILKHADANKLIFADESYRFGMRAYENGYDIYMNGDVICKHYKRGRLKLRVQWQFKILRNKLIAMVSRFYLHKKSQQLLTKLSTTPIT